MHPSTSIHSSIHPSTHPFTEFHLLVYSFTQTLFPSHLIISSPFFPSFLASYSCHLIERKDTLVLESSERRLDLSQRKQSMYLPVIANLALREEYYGGSDRTNTNTNNNPQQTQSNRQHNSNNNQNNNSHNNNNHNHSITTTSVDDEEPVDPYMNLEAWQPPSPLYDNDLPLDHPYDRSPPTSADNATGVRIDSTKTGARADSSGTKARPGVGGVRVAATAGSQLHHYLNQVTYRGDNVLSGCALVGIDIPEGQIRAQHLLSSHKHPRVAHPLVPLASHGLFGGPKPKPKPPTYVPILPALLWLLMYTS